MHNSDYQLSKVDLRVNQEECVVDDTVCLPGKLSHNVSEENSHCSSYDGCDEMEGIVFYNEGKISEIDEDDEDEEEDDDVEKEDNYEKEGELLTGQRHSKRKPSKSNIKRIPPQNSTAKMPLSLEMDKSQFSVENSIQTAVSSATINPCSVMTATSAAYMLQVANSGHRSQGYRCDVCGKVFRVPSRYDSHMTSHSKGKPYCCETCGKLFASQLKLDLHQPIHGRDRSEAFTCPQCGRECTNWRAYLYHIAKHTSNGGKKHNCNVCGRQFHAAQRLRKHMQSHMDGKHFCCFKCGKLFESQKRLSTHSMAHNSERTEPLSCVDCGKEYTNWKAFQQHMKTHGTEGVVYDCELCPSEFFTQYEKEKHKRVHTSSERYCCQQCNKCFRSQSQLAVHERKHQGSKNHECPICGLECARAYSLKQHMKLHAREEEFFCHLCGQTFVSGEALSKHAAVHSHEREYICDQCGKCFATKVHHHRHLMTHVVGNQYPCRLCGHMFDSMAQLDTHTAKHSTCRGGQKFACLACCDVFDSQLELDAHAHTHGKLPPFVCGLCGKLFAEQRYFRQHMKRHIAGAEKQKPGRKKYSQGVPKSSGTLDIQLEWEKNCHVCGREFEHRDAFIVHMEEHKRNGLLMYMDLMKPKSPCPSQMIGHDGDSEDDSVSGTESDSGTESCTRASTINCNMDTTMSSQNISKQVKTEGVDKHTMNEQIHQQNSSNPGTQRRHLPGGDRPVDIKLDLAPSRHDVRDSSILSGSISYSSPVFPDQIHCSQATPFHSTANQFLRNVDSYNNSMVNCHQGDMPKQYAGPQKGLPNFADFRQHFGFIENYQYAEYSEEIPAVRNQFSDQRILTCSAKDYPTSGVSLLAPNRSVQNSEKRLTSKYESSDLYAKMKMPIFTGQAVQNQEEVTFRLMQEREVQMSHFDPMLQFQTLNG